MKRWSRRDFLKLAGVAAGGAVGTGAVLAQFRARPSTTAKAPIVPGLRHIPMLTAADPPPADEDYDLLFAPNPTSQEQVLRDFGLLRSHSAHQLPPASAASYIAGYSSRNAVGANNTPGSDAAIWPFDGVLPTDQFTIIFYIRSKGADYVAQPAASTTYHWFFDVDGSGVNGLYLYRAAASPAPMRLRWHYEPLWLEARLNLLRGDIPADTWKRIVCVWDGVSLTIATGDNARSATSSPITSVRGAHWGGTLAENVALPGSCCLLDGVSGGLYVNGGGPVPANSGGPFEIEGPYIYRYQRSFSAGAAVPGRTIIIDPSSTLGAFPTDVSGVLNQYSGIEGLGNTSVDLDIAGRDAVIAKAAHDGLKTIRFPDLTSYVRFHYAPGAANNGVSAYDWTDFDSRINLWKRKGITRFHASFLGTPAPLQPGTFPMRPTAGIARRSTALSVPATTTRMSSGTALFISEGDDGEKVYLTSDYVGGAGDMSISPTSRSYTTAAVIEIGEPIGKASGNVRFAPAIDNAAWGQVCADVVDRIVNVLGVKVVHLGFWNEPLSANLYCGNKAAYVSQWLAAAQAIDADRRIAPWGIKLGAGECAVWVPGETSADESETGWQKSIVEQAVTSGVPMPAMSSHAYTGDLNLEQRFIQDQSAYLKARGLPNAKVRIGEWNLNLASAGQSDDASAAGGIHPEVWKSDYLAAFAHAFIFEAMAAGVADMAFTRLQQLDLERYRGAEQQLHLLSNDRPARAFAIYRYFQMLWKVSVGAERISCASNWPDVRAFGAKSGVGPTTYTVVYGRFRPWKSKSDSAAEVDLAWSDLPSRLSWKRWHLDHTNLSDGTLKPMAAGDQNNLPGSVSLLPLSVGCIQLVG
jgi:hypothetical protein